MTLFQRAAAAALFALFPTSAHAQAGPPCAACVVLIADAGQTVAMPVALGDLELLIRASPAAIEGTLAALHAVAAAGGRGGLYLAGLPASPLRLPSPLPISRAVVDLTGADPLPDPDALAFQVKSRLAELRGSAPGAALGLFATGAQIRELFARGVAPYIDFVVTAGYAAAGRSIWRAGGAPIGELHPVDATVAPPIRDGSGRWLWEAPKDVLQARTLMADLARAVPLLPRGLLPEGRTRATCGGRPVPAYRHPHTQETIAIAEGCAPGDVAVAPASSGVELIALSTGDVIVRVPPPEGSFTDQARVVAPRELTVEEIVARHQAAAAGQRARVDQLISTGTMTLTFEAPGFPAPVAVSSRAVIYTDATRTEIEQRGIRVNGVEFSGRRVPRLPLVEPERVASPPLQIALTSAYRYALAGRARIGGTACYVVSFAPSRRDASSFAGRAWIAADSFAMVRVAAAQTGLRGPIVSSEQVDEFRPEADGIWLLARSEVRQTYEGAAHRTPIHRLLTIERHDVNPPDFAARRAAAYASAAVMLRDTPEGFKYLQRGRGRTAPSTVPPVEARGQRVKTLALGAIVDPNITHPLPFAGLGYVDFDLFGTGAQFSGFFGGTYAQAAFSIPSLGGSRWQMGGRAFGIASAFNDRSFAGGREVYRENIRQRPAHASAWTVRPLTPRLAIRAGYELDYTRYTASDLTDPAFAVPADQVAHGVRVSVEGQRAGWHGAAWWVGARRTGWRDWGYRHEIEESGLRHRDYQRFGVTLVRPIVAGPRLAGRFEGAWMSGRDLDRFSRYSFGTFDNRLRGYPSALIRYDRGAVVRASAAWAAGRLLRVDGFLDTAYVHDAGFGSGLRNYTGLGAAVEAPAPFGTLVAAEWGYGFRGVNADGRSGTQVVRISAFKIF